ncbi:MAG: hypothetical protein PQJ61_16920 [Spirochaetales bacterium]|uniref:DUF7336 domain-containing protein n=1 Tax=Candidatus Thalassospirochaeta sargassi TaxID=3119039 RepID=A0AAJ1IK26_9SPIO|nr:hypothetical protein [Spirochaetales bacterium]
MASKLWFVTDGVRLIGVFEDKESAKEKVEMYQDDPDYDYFCYYSISYDDLEDYPEEFDFAMKKGFLD